MCQLKGVQHALPYQYQQRYSGPLMLQVFESEENNPRLAIINFVSFLDIAS